MEEEVVLANYTDEELLDAKQKLEIEYGKYVDEWAREVAYLINEKNVDPYSYWGEKKVKKVTKKYTNITSDIQLALEKLAVELQKRDNYNFEQSFIGGKSYFDETLTEKEFFEKEQLKTLKYRKLIGQEEDDE
ncbi:MAG: hypothetical protein IJA23_04355 [Clostridia bacterium]|nr:hypothetical protein [Clostridia bacterium]